MGTKVVAHHIAGRRFRVMVDEHAVSTDSAAEYGEAGTAFSPPQLFAASVAACIGEFVANSCRLHGIPVESLSVEVEYEKYSQPRRLGILEARIRIKPEPSEAVRRRLVGVARHATLVNTLLRPPEVIVRFEDSS
ncbi:MAG: OsmC family protein [Anaerolineae bacterium]|nr:OsmC family protein [Anaerolineae bacterium]